MALIFHLIKLGNHTKRWVLRFAWRVYIYVCVCVCMSGKES